MRQSQVRIFCSVYFLGSLKSGRDPIWACYSAQPGWLLCILVLQIRQESLQTEEFSAMCVLALGEVSALMTVWSGWRHRKWIVFPGLFQRSMQGNPWLSLQLLPGVEEYVQCLHSSVSSFTSPDLQHWKLEKNQYLESWDWIGHKSWVFTWGNQARASEGDALTKRKLVI